MIRLPCSGRLFGASLLAGLFFFAPSPAIAEFDPFHVPRDRFREQVRRVVIRPFRFPATLPDSRLLSRHAMRHVTKELERLGFEVVDPAEFEDRWRGYSEALGGVFDPTTGAADTEKYRLAFEYTLRDLVNSQGVDAVVRLSHFLRVADVGSDGVYLWAAGSSLLWEGRRIPDRIGIGRVWPQRVHAAWLGIEIRDASGQALFDVGYPLGWTRIYMLRGFEEFPPEELYTEETIDEAFNRCLAELAE